MNFYRILFETKSDAYKSCIGVLGAGGKSSLIHRLGEELVTEHQPLILTSLTKDGLSPDRDLHFFADLEDEHSRQAILTRKHPVFIMASLEDEHKLVGLDETQLEQLTSMATVTLFECDGARKRPLKAHQPYDPKIPDFATHTIIVVGADAVGARVERKMVHRPELFRELWEVKAQYELEPEFIAKVLTSQYGYLQKVPPGMPLSYFVNKADTHPQQALKLARAIARISSAPVFFGSLEKDSLERML